MTELYLKTKLFLSKIRICFLIFRMFFAIIKRMITLRIRIITIKLEMGYVTTTAFMKIAGKFMRDTLLTQLKELSTYTQSFIISLLGNIVLFLFYGNFSFQRVFIYFCCSLIGGMLLPIVLSFLGSFYLMCGKFEKGIEESSLTSTQKFTINVLVRASKKQESPNVIYSSHIGCKFTTIIAFLYCTKTQKEIFEPIAADWQEEYFEALFKKQVWKARWINVRYTYAFLAAMWIKSPIGDLIEIIIKFAK